MAACGPAPGDREQTALEEHAPNREHNKVSLTQILRIKPQAVVLSCGGVWSSPFLKYRLASIYSHWSGWFGDCLSACTGVRNTRGAERIWSATVWRWKPRETMITDKTASPKASSKCGQNARASMKIWPAQAAALEGDSEYIIARFCKAAEEKTQLPEARFSAERTRRSCQCRWDGSLGRWSVLA
jgi:hypothetical protein